LEWQKFADHTGLCLAVCHFPPGTSKWNKIEHRLFSFITSNWRGEPLQDNGMDSPFKDGITMCQAGRLTNQLST
jgi:hypothetical protein